MQVPVRRLNIYDFYVFKLHQRLVGSFITMWGYVPPSRDRAFLIANVNENRWVRRVKLIGSLEEGFLRFVNRDE